MAVRYGRAELGPVLSMSVQMGGAAWKDTHLQRGLQTGETQAQQECLRVPAGGGKPVSIPAPVLLNRQANIRTRALGYRMEVSRKASPGLRPSLYRATSGWWIPQHGQAPRSQTVIVKEKRSNGLRSTGSHSGRGVDGDDLNVPRRTEGTWPRCLSLKAGGTGW
jgi:hypothetical protein